MVELYDSKQKGVWEQITLKMIEIIECTVWLTPM